MWGIVAVLAVLAAFLFRVWLGGVAERERMKVVALKRNGEEKRRRALAEVRAAEEEGELSPVDPDGLPFVLAPDEALYWSEPSSLYESRTERAFDAVGTDWQVADRWSVGRISGREIQTDVVKFVDSGVLAVTNRRLLFAGDREQRVVPLSGIATLAGEPDALLVGASGQAKRMKFSSRNGLLAEWTAKHLAEAAR